MSRGDARAASLCLLGLIVLFTEPYISSSELSALLHEAQDLEAWIVQCRRALHKIPELDFEEVKTGDLIRTELDALGIRYQFPIAQTGILATLGQGEPKVALRADIDALPIQEETGLAFQSQHAGKMHACGHDAHMAMLLGAARLLKAREGELRGTVLLLFQPAEEAEGGARHVLESGALRGASAIHGLHVWPPLESGKVTSRAGTILAASTRFAATIRGKGGHAGSPHLTSDPVVAAAAVVGSLQTLVSRETDPVDGAVLSVTRLSTGNGATNVIPDSVEIGGSLRALTLPTFERLIQRTEEVIRQVAEVHRCRADIEWRKVPYIPTVNNAGLVRIVQKAATALSGPDSFLQLDKPSLAAEDFGFLAGAMPGVFSFLGIRNNSAGTVHGLHTSRFLVDESVLHIGSALHTAFALEYLHSRAADAADAKEL